MTSSDVTSQHLIGQHNTTHHITSHHITSHEIKLPQTYMPQYTVVVARTPTPPPFPAQGGGRPTFAPFLQVFGFHKFIMFCGVVHVFHLLCFHMFHAFHFTWVGGCYATTKYATRL